MVLALMFGVSRGYSTTWATVYPYIQKTEAGKIKCVSIPYCVHGPFDQGETFVYGKGKLLYSIGKYFTNGFYTIGDGRYLVEFAFQVSKPSQDMLVIGDTAVTRSVNLDLDAVAVNIYEAGRLKRTIMFSELGIDETTLRPFGVDWYSWKYVSSEHGRNSLEASMGRHPAFIEEDRLCLIASDGQLVEVHVPTGEIVGRSMASEVLGERLEWNPSGIIRKYRRVRYPEKFYLPHLKDGRSMEEAAADLLRKVMPNGVGRGKDPSVYLHTLLIDARGRCELAYVSVTPGEGSDTSITALEEGLVTWLKEQTFDTRTLPRGFPKFKYSGFLRLDQSP